MAGSRTALALISICILLCLSGLGNCRVPFQREEVVGDKEQSVHLLLPTEKEEFNEIAIESQPLSLPLEKPDLRGNDGIFPGERSRGFRFGRPGGHHHGKFNRRGQRKSEHMPFPLEFPGMQAEPRDFHPRMDRPLPEKNDFGSGVLKGEWMRQRHGHPEEEKREKENEHMPFPARGMWPEFIFHLFPGHDNPQEFHPRVDEFRPLPRGTEFDHGFPNGGEGRQHRDEAGDRKIDNEHMPFPPRVQWPEFIFHLFPGHAHPAEFHPRVDEFRPLPREIEFVHGFPSGGEGRQHRDERGERKRDNEHMPFPEEQTQPFPHAFPVEESTEFHSRVAEFLPLPRERDFDHGFPGREGRQPRHGHGHGHGHEEEKETEHFPFPTKGERTESFTSTFPVQAESTKFHPRVEEFLPLPRERDFEHSFPGGEGRQPRHRHEHGEVERGEERQGRAGERM